MGVAFVEGQLGVGSQLAGLGQGKLPDGQNQDDNGHCGNADQDQVEAAQTAICLARPIQLVLEL